jgi:hypothetical protein
MIGQRCDMAPGPAGSDYHEISEGRAALKFDQDKILGFVVFEKLGERIGDRPDLADRCVSGRTDPGCGG